LAAGASETRRLLVFFAGVGSLVTSPSSVPSAALVPPRELALVDPGASLCGLASGDVSPGRGFAAWSGCPAATAAAVITCACEIVSV